MTITKHTLIADVNTALVAQFNQQQCSAIGLCGLDAQLFEIKRFDQQYGYVRSSNHFKYRLIVLFMY